jgi:hypothetical protein
VPNETKVGEFTALPITRGARRIGTHRRPHEGHFPRDLGVALDLLVVVFLAGRVRCHDGRDGPDGIGGPGRRSPQSDDGDH